MVDMCHLSCRSRSVPFILPLSVWRYLSFVVVLMSAARGMQSGKLQPQDQNVTIGGQAVLPCEVQGVQPIIWNQGTQPIFVNGQRNSNVSPRFNVTANNTLIIDSVKLADEMLYTCSLFGLESVQIWLTVLVAPGQPNITTNTSVPLVENSVISFTCSTSGGKPAPNIQWLRNGLLIDNDILTAPSFERGVSTSQIIITLSRIDHNANYSCIVFNQANQDSPLIETRILDVQYSPFIQFQPNYLPYHIKSGSNVTLRCLIDANPPYTDITWERKTNGVQETLNEYSDTWTSSSIQESDSANYTCTAKNIIQGSPKIASASTFIDVQYAPRVTTMSVIIANISTQVNLSCSIRSNPPAYQIRWQKLTQDSAAVVVSNQANFIFFVNKQHAGNYTCTAMNRLEPSGLPAEHILTQGFTILQVQYAPGAAAIQPTSSSLVNQTITLSCSVDDTGYPFPIFEWKLVETSQIVQSSMSPDYVITQAALSDNGNYTCIPKNQMGTGIPATVSVEINSLPLFVTSTPNLLTVPINQLNVVLKHEIEGRPLPVVQWLKDNMQLSQMSNLYAEETTSVMVDKYSNRVSTKVMFVGTARDQNKLQIEDIGVYKCLVISSNGTLISRSTNFSVEFVPIITKPSARLQIAVDLGENATLICTVQSNPMPAIYWFKQGERLTNSSKMNTNQQSAEGVATYQSVLYIKYIETLDFGDYTCEANNNNGQARTLLTLSATSMPDAPTNLTVITKTWESVLLQWMPGFNGGYDQTFNISVQSIKYDLQLTEVKPREVNSFNVTKLQPATLYTFSIYGVNRLGKGAKSADYTCQTDVLIFPALQQIPEFNVDDKQLVIPNNLSHSYCLRIEVSDDNGQSWALSHACAIAVQGTVPLYQQGATDVNVYVCLVYRQDVCGEPIASKINASKMSDLTETQVIVIGCVCAVILLALVIVLICIIIKRRQRNKNYNGNVNSARPIEPENGAILNPNSSTYENQDLSFSGGSPQTPVKETKQFIALPEEHMKEGENFESGIGNGYSLTDKIKPPKKVIYEVVV